MNSSLVLNKWTDPTIKVSVSLITYNQKHYISQAIESILQQKVAFKIEIIIGDDFSTDGTRDILISYQERYPEIIKLILHPQKNEGVPGKLNFLSTIRAAKGRYIALLDGDDYWSDMYKLQKQVDFLDNNPDYALCFHRVTLLKEDKNTTLSNWDEDGTYTVEDLAKGNFIYVPSVVFKNGLIDVLPEWFMDTYTGDYIFHMLNSRHGKLKYFAQPMAVYRIHGNNFWLAKGQREQYERFASVIELLFNEFSDFPQALTNMKYHYAALMAAAAEFYYQEKDLDTYQQFLKKAFDASAIFMKEWLVVSKTSFDSIAHSNAYAIGRAITIRTAFLKKLFLFNKTNRSNL